MEELVIGLSKKKAKYLKIACFWHAEESYCMVRIN